MCDLWGERRCLSGRNAKDISWASLFDPTAMSIAALSAAKVPSKAGEILGYQQSAAALGEAVGPAVGAALYQANLVFPYVLFLSLELAVLSLGVKVFYDATRSGEVSRSPCSVDLIHREDSKVDLRAHLNVSALFACIVHLGV